MLEIDRTAGDDADKVPTAEEARLARQAAHDALQQLRRERETLPGLRAAAIERGDFTEASRVKDQMAMIEDRVAHAQQVLARAEVALLECELAAAEREARSAAEGLLRAFDAEERARAAHAEATARRAGQQAQQQAYQLRVEQLRQAHAEARRTLDAKE